MPTGASLQLENVDISPRDLSVNAKPQSLRAQGTPSKPDAASTSLPTKHDAQSSTISRASHSNEVRNSLNAQTFNIGRDAAMRKGTHPQTAGIKTRLGKRIPPIPPRTRPFTSDDIGIMEKLSRHIEVRSDRRPRGHADLLLSQSDRESRQSKLHKVSTGTDQLPLDVLIRPKEIKCEPKNFFNDLKSNFLLWRCHSLIDFVFLI